MRLFQIDDGEQHLWAANNEDEALAAFHHMSWPDGLEEGVEVSWIEIRRERWAAIPIHDEDCSGPACMTTAADLVGDPDAVGPARHIGSTLL